MEGLVDDEALRAIVSAGLSNEPRRWVPHRSEARCQVAGVPGTPTDSPELTTVMKSIAVPSGLVKVPAS